MASGSRSSESMICGSSASLATTTVCPKLASSSGSRASLRAPRPVQLTMQSPTTRSRSSIAPSTTGRRSFASSHGRYSRGSHRGTLIFQQATAGIPGASWTTANSPAAGAHQGRVADSAARNASTRSTPRRESAQRSKPAPRACAAPNRAPATADPRRKGSHTAPATPLVVARPFSLATTVTS